MLHLTKYSDSSAVVHTIDSLHGRKSYFVRGLKSGRKSTAMFHPLNILDIISYDSPKSSLSSLKEWTPVASFDSIRSNIYKSTIAMFISEVIFRSIRNEDADSSLSDWLCGAVARLESTDGPVANFHLWFLASFCTRMGFRPDGAIEPQGIFNPWEEDLFLLIMKSTFEETMSLELSSSRRNAFSKKMLQYLSYHIGCEINARSLDVLHEVLA